MHPLVCHPERSAAGAPNQRRVLRWLGRLGSGVEGPAVQAGTCRRLCCHCAGRPSGATNEAMNKAIVTYTSLDDMKAEELREWRALPAHERLRAVSEITLAAYRMKEPAQDVRRIQRTLVHLQRPQR